MNNITAQDLMIGDWVTCSINNKYYKVSALTSDIELEGDRFIFHSPCDDIKPIPLTAEILEKNGFVKSYGVSDTPPYDTDEEGNMYYSFKGEHKFWGWWQPDNTYYIPANAMGDIVIKYVHELQHALRLAGIEKEIEL